MTRRNPDRRTPIHQAYDPRMARPNQRYIEPDAIYTDMDQGAMVRVPAQFPFTWNPVNGLGATTATPAGFLEDAWDTIVQVGEGAAGASKKAVEDRAKQGAEDFLNKDPVGKLILDKIKEKAVEGVTEVVRGQAPNLMLLAVAGGAVGGALSSKLGKTGTVLALVVAGWAGYQLLNAKPTM